MIIDSHAHINFKEFADEIDSVIKRALDNNTWLINVGSNFETSKKAVQISDQYEKGVYASIGIHPIHLIKDITESATFDNKEYKFKTKKEEFDYKKFKNLALSSKKVKAIGEVGLDVYYYKKDEVSDAYKIQTQVFEKFIDLAQELDFPLILHCRGTKDDPYEAYDRIIKILENKKVNRGVMHCYGGNLDQAKKIVDLGLYVGFTGILTFKKATELHEIAKEIPLEKILIETDAPFLAPEPFRGKRNEPLYVKYVGEKLAELKDISFEKVAEQTFENAKTLFQLDEEL